MSLRSILVLLALQICVYCNAQDEVFSQFYALPMQMNPALTGAYDGTYRLSMSYRDQWNNNLGSSFKTFAAGGDTRFKMNFDNRRTEDHFGVGLFFISDRVREFQASNNQISTYFAYHKKLGSRIPSYLGAGIQMGVIQRNINYDNISFGDQFDQIDGFNLPTQETLPPNNIGIFNLSAGINYYIELDESRYYIGAAIHHLNQPNMSYFNRLDNINPSTITDQKLESRYVFHVSMDKVLQYRYEIQPRFVYQQQDNNAMFSLGTNFQYTFKSEDMGLVLGLWVNAVNDLDGMKLNHLSPLLGLLKGNFILGLSYDLGMRDTFNNPFNLNTFELSIRFSGEHFNDNNFCPSF